MKTTARPKTRREQLAVANRAPGTLVSRTTRGTFSRPTRSVFDPPRNQTIVPRWG
jgi:hypothetical protein